MSQEDQTMRADTWAGRIVGAVARAELPFVVGRYDAREGAAPRQSRTGRLVGALARIEPEQLDSRSVSTPTSRAVLSWAAQPAPARFHNLWRVASAVAVVLLTLMAALSLEAANNGAGKRHLLSVHGRVPGDAAHFDADVPGHLVQVNGPAKRVNSWFQVTTGQRFTVIWLAQNTGSVTWVGRYLSRTTPEVPGLCPSLSPDHVQIPTTRPGGAAEIRLLFVAPSFVAPNAPDCAISRAITDASGESLFPAAVTLHLIVRVVQG